MTTESIANRPQTNVRPMPTNGTQQAAPAAPKPTLSSLVKRGVHHLPLRVLVYGPQKIGKTTFSSGAPNGVVIGPEDGTGLLDQPRIDAHSWRDIMGALHLLATEPNDFKTVILDTLDHIEPLIWAHICAEYHVASIELAAGGYGKGYGFALDEWRKMTIALDRLRALGKGVILIAHAKTANFKNPDGPDYDRYFLAMNERASLYLQQWVDVVLFANYETFVTVDKNTKKAKGFGGTERVLHANRRAAFEAGNRINLPDSFPLSWADFAQYAYPSKDDTAARDAVLRSEIAELATKLDDTAIAAKVASTVDGTKPGDINRLSEILNRLSSRIAAKGSDQ